MPHLSGKHLELLRTRYIHFITGEGKWENLGETWALANVLGIKIAADGVFGSGTDKQVKRFQKSVGLPTTGVVNRVTWMSLLSASAQR